MSMPEDEVVLQNIIDISLNLKHNPKLYVNIITECAYGRRVPGCVFNLRERGNDEVLISRKFKTVKEAESVVDIIKKVEEVNK